MPRDMSPEALADLHADVALLRGLIEAMSILVEQENPHARNGLFAVIRQAQPLAASIDTQLG